MPLPDFRLIRSHTAIAQLISLSWLPRPKVPGRPGFYNGVSISKTRGLNHIRFGAFAEISDQQKWYARFFQQTGRGSLLVWLLTGTHWAAPWELELNGLNR